MITEQDRAFMALAIEESRKGPASDHGGPFGCVVVKDGTVIAAAHNMVTATNDPTAHAEVQAIRMACAALEHYQLDGCDMYCSCEPCPMCFGAIYWARPARVFYANTREDAAAIGFDDQFIYEEIATPPAHRRITMLAMDGTDARHVFDDWTVNGNKQLY